ncbi:hypothetical protein EGJ57_04690 [Brucella anthropi]|uniref:hypothetical protein n=1 Tax=Brucella anthropi TaxID=529 RepID=UPI000F6593F7|nr:hypothetical protein [Brucella anthropi]RRY22069.1 hypothetical protein EGJ57_04690 [Brucella anthropi]
MASELKPCQIADALEKCDWAGASIGNKMIVLSAIEALRNTHPAPAATDTGLETVGGEYLDGHTWKPMPAGVTDFALRGFKTRALCVRSQAAELLAAERAEKEEWKRRAEYAERELANSILKGKSIEADNAAQAARVKELETDLKTYQDDTTDEVNAKIDLEFKIVDLEAKLTAAEKDAATWKANFWDLSDKTARAVLGRKPS